jgi:SpoVK/Ycf46/Vps4 family AAA+-type ATPase
MSYAMATEPTRHAIREHDTCSETHRVAEAPSTTVSGYFSDNSGGFTPFFKKAVDTVPAGVYCVYETVAGLVAYPEPFLDGIEDVEGEMTGYARQLLTEINRFQSSEELYRAAGLPWKRGILLYGSPGCGKTRTVAMVVNKLVEKGAVAILVDRVSLVQEFFKELRKVEPTRLVVFIHEEFEQLIEENSQRQYLAFLDGASEVDGVVHLMTTNFISSIPDRIKNRRSRVDTLLPVSPGAAKEVFGILRKFYKQFQENCQQKTPLTDEALYAMAELAEGLPTSDIKEAFIYSVLLQLGSFEDRIKELQSIE